MKLIEAIRDWVTRVLVGIALTGVGILAVTGVWGSALAGAKG